MSCGHGFHYAATSWQRTINPRAVKNRTEM